MECVAVISSNFKKGQKHFLSFTLHSSNNWSHCAAVQQELNRIEIQTILHQLEQVGVGLEAGDVVLDQPLPCGGQGWAGEEEGFHCSLLRPSLFQGTQ